MDDHTKHTHYLVNLCFWSTQSLANLLLFVHVCVNTGCTDSLRRHQQTGAKNGQGEYTFSFKGYACEVNLLFYALVL